MTRATASAQSSSSMSSISSPANTAASTSASSQSAPATAPVSSPSSSPSAPSASSGPAPSSSQSAASSANRASSTGCGISRASHMDISVHGKTQQSGREPIGMGNSNAPHRLQPGLPPLQGERELRDKTSTAPMLDRQALKLGSNAYFQQPAPRPAAPPLGAAHMQTSRQPRHRPAWPAPG